eukprot:COSAG01_NODE_5455_length_4255_cov_2.391963_1_plen_55_part_10
MGSSRIYYCLDAACDTCIQVSQADTLVLLGCHRVVLACHRPPSVLNLVVATAGLM